MRLTRTPGLYYWSQGPGLWAQEADILVGDKQEKTKTKTKQRRGKATTVVSKGLSVAGREPERDAPPQKKI